MIIITLFTFQSPFLLDIAAFEEVILPLSRALKHNTTLPLYLSITFFDIFIGKSLKRSNSESLEELLLRQLC